MRIENVVMDIQRQWCLQQIEPFWLNTFWLGSSVLPDSPHPIFLTFDEDSLDGSQLTPSWQVRLQSWSSCNEPVLVIIMSALSAISGRYWDWINQTQVNFSKNIPSPLREVMQLRVSVLPHTARLSAAWGINVFLSRKHRLGHSECSQQSDQNVIYGREKTTLLVWTVMSCDGAWWLHICVISGWCDAVWRQSRDWCDVCRPGHVTWRSACHHAMIATVCTNHNQGPWPARNALCQWPVSRHALIFTNCSLDFIFTKYVIINVWFLFSGAYFI